MPLIVLSGDVCIGKTSSLIQVFAKKNSVGGFVTPDIQGERKIMRLSTGEIIDFQITSPNQGLMIEKIGRFEFLIASFLEASSWVLRDIENSKKLIVIDEWGPLELQKKGFYPHLFNQLQQIMVSHEIFALVVVRSGIVNDFIEQFHSSKQIEIIEIDELAILASRLGC